MRTEMGLDSVEFIMAVEAAFGIDIPDAEAERVQTPRDLIGYLTRRLPMSDAAAPVCLSRRAFYRARRACVVRFGHPRDVLGPGTPLLAVLPEAGRRTHWKALRGDLGVEVWPMLLGPVTRHFLGGVETLGQLAGTVATQNAAALRRPDEPWSPAEVERLVVALIEMELGVDMRRFTLDSSFVHDMGVD
ncbi:MAG TPA: phosphopantetheine-binding protein [Longimicrobium sp.]